MSKTRVQVILEEEEKARFHEHAVLEGQSLSAWLRAAGLKRLESAARTRMETRDQLDEFFRRCDVNEQGREPDWSEHLEVADSSRGSGGTDT